MKQTTSIQLFFVFTSVLLSSSRGEPDDEASPIFPRVNLSVMANSDRDKMNEQVKQLGKLQNVPKMYPAEGFSSDDSSIKAIYFDGLPWKGKSTRVFAWLGVPNKSELKNADGKVPGVVLVHGGGGTAFADWVKKWNSHGFAAISIAVEGQTDEVEPKQSGKRETSWKSHEWAGPARNGIYGDSDQPLADQWMYHAVADTVLANTLMRSLPEVDSSNVGLMGVSWGGIITSTVIGIDSRFAFAIPTYGCGHLEDAPNQYGTALSENATYHRVWDPMLRLGLAKMPVLWFSWPGDLHFPLDCQAASYRAAPGLRSIALVPGMKHGHGPAWNRNEAYAFAKSVVTSGKPWCIQSNSRLSDDTASVTWTLIGTKALDQAQLVSTVEGGATGSRTWTETPAKLQRDGQSWTATAKIPHGTTSWFINAQSGDLIASSEYQVTGAKSSTASTDTTQDSQSPQKAKLFARLDADSNRTISSKEYLSHYAAVFDQFDKDRSGKLDSGEFGNAAAIKAGDKDMDGKLTKAEFLAFFEIQFRNLDSNRDLLLTVEEWK
jgi:dienelactone hydrolase